MGAKLPVEHQLNIPEWRKLRPLLSDTQLVDFLEYGFPVGYTGAEPPVTGLANHSSAISAPTHVKEYIEVEVQKDAMMGPFYEAPFQQWWRNNPLMTRAKRDSLKRQVILDLSFPDIHSVNASIPKNALEGASFKLKLPRPDDLAARVEI